MFGAQGGRLWLRSAHHQRQCRKLLRTPSFCTNAKSASSNNAKRNGNDVVAADERYRQLENLDMMTAAKMLFTDPPKKKKFGFDFHLVQFFFACMPSLAVYLVAQYARYEMRKMEAEVEQKKKLRDEALVKEKEKEMELNPLEEQEAKSDPQLVEVRVRLDKLEETLKEIVVESKKQSNSNVAKNQTIDGEKTLKEIVVESKKQSNSNVGEKNHMNSSAPSDTTSSSQSNKTVDEEGLVKHNFPKLKTELGEEVKTSMETPNTSLRDPKSPNQGGGAS